MAPPPAQITAPAPNQPPGAILPVTATDAQGSRFITFSESSPPTVTGIVGDTAALTTSTPTTTSTSQLTTSSSSSIITSTTASAAASSTTTAAPAAASSGGMDPTLKLVAILVPIVVVLALIPLGYLYYIRQRTKREDAAMRQPSPESQRAPTETKLLAHKTSRSDNSISLLPSPFSDSNRLRAGSFDIFNPPMSTSASPLGMTSFSDAKQTTSYTPLAPINLNAIRTPTGTAATTYSSSRSRLDPKPPPASYTDTAPLQPHYSGTSTLSHHRPHHRSQFSGVSTLDQHESAMRHSGRPSSELERAPSPTLPSPSVPTFRAQEAWPLPVTTAGSGIASLRPGSLRPPSSVYAASTRSPQRAIFGGSGIGEARTTTPMDDPPPGLGFFAGRGEGAGARMSDAVSELSFSTSVGRGRDADEVSIVSAMGGEDEGRSRGR